MAKKELELTRTIILKEPVKVGDVEFKELKLREPKAKELSAAADAGNNVDGIVELVSLVAGIPHKAADDLCARDLKECDAFFGQFN